MKRFLKQLANNTCIKALVFFLLFNVSFTFKSFSQTQEFQPTEVFKLNLKIENVGWYELNAFMSESNQQLFIPVVPLFELLKINQSTSENGAVVEGYFINNKNAYKIDYNVKLLTYNDLQVPLTQSNSYFDELGNLSLSPELLNVVFKLNVSFDFRSLSAVLSPNYELPVIRSMKLDDARRFIKGFAGDTKYDVFYPRKYHILKPGKLDWSISANQSPLFGNEIKAGIALGTEMFGGELSTWFFYSDKYGFNRNQQRYHWRWVDNEVKLIRQVQFGRIYNRSIATLLFPVDGFMVTNAPTTIRKALGTYQIADQTNPDWLVELYINHVLMDYTRADASGYFSFQVPIVYGSTEVTLRYYGPNGEEHADRKTYNMPYNMLPVGEFEYRVSGGVLLNRINSIYGRAETNLGITKWLTAGAGYEYLNSIAGNPHIPFGNVTLQPFSRMLLSGEYAHKVRYKGTLNYNFRSNSMFELYYAKYVEQQQAIVYNFLEERFGALTFPIRFKNLSTVTRASFRQNIYPNFSYNAAELMFSTFYRNVSANFSNFLNYTDFDDRNVYSSLSLGFRFDKGFTFRPSVMYSFSENKPLWYQNFVSYKAELEKQIFKRGYLSVGYERNNLANYESVNMALRYDFSFLSTYASAHYANNEFQTSQSARGSLAFGGGNGYVHFDAREAVGRSAIAIKPYVDINFNQKRDANEPAVFNLGITSSGGKALYRKNDSIVRIVGLDPFVDYSLVVNESSLTNIAWRVNNKHIKFTTDPNQFKTIELAVLPMGEVSGTVLDENANGVSRILMHILNSEGKPVTKILTESDGFFSYLGLKPGQYSAEVDSTQLQVLNMTAKPIIFKIDEDVQGDIVELSPTKLIRTAIELPHHKDSLQAYFEGKQNLNRSQMAGLRSQSDSLALLHKLNPYTDKNNVDPQMIQRFDSLLRYVLLFDFNSTVVRSEFYGTLKQLGTILRANESLKLEIQGHTDNVGDEQVNLQFSKRRANSVKRILVKYGVSEERLRIVGFGENKPAPGNKNRTKLERAQNRRVVFKALSANKMENIDVIANKNPDNLTRSDIRNLKSTVTYVNEQNPFEVKWRYMYSFLFYYGKSNIRPEQGMLVRALASVMKQHPCLIVQLESHTDTESSDAFNMELSIDRAQSVWDALVFQGVDRLRIRVANYGKNAPLTTEENEAKKALNRRVAFKPHADGCQLNLDSLVTQEIIRTYNTRISNQHIINHDGRYMIQTGAFKNEELALMMAVKLRHVLPDNIYIVNDNELYRVIVGYTNTRSEAKDIARVIQASGILANPYNK